MQQFFTFIMDNWYLFLALIIIIALLIMNTVRSRLLGFQELKPAEAVQLMNREEPLVLDVRELNEFQEGHIRGALHIPVGELEGRIAELEEWKEKPILVYCRAGQRSARAGAILGRQGFKHLYKLDGGMMAWSSAHLPSSRAG